MGAGLPFDLPDLAQDFPDVALMPILSDARGVNIVLKKWMRKKRLPDAIVIEHPRYAGGHLGATRLEEINDPRFDFEPVLAGVFEVMRELGIERERIPLIVAGGINSHAEVRALLALGASAVQLGTPFAVTLEGDAHPNFKKVLAEAKPADIVTFMSVAGLPARAVRTPWLEQLPEARKRTPGARESRSAPVRSRPQLPHRVRTARRHCIHGPVLHRHAPCACPQRRRQERIVLQGQRAAAVRCRDPAGRGTRGIT